MNKKYTTLILVTVILTVILVIGGTYAFFQASIDNSDNEEMKIISGNMELTFVDNNGILLDNARPGDKEEKTFTVENTGTIDDKYNFTYNIKLTKLNVTFLEEDLQYTLIEYTNEKYDEIKQNGVNERGFINKDTINENNEMYLAKDIVRPLKGIKHYYKLMLEFKNLSSVNQNYNQGAEFYGKINIDQSSVEEIIPPLPQSSTFLAKLENAKEEGSAAEDENNNIRYIGTSSLKNYIWFNCNDYDNVTQTNAEVEKGCEKWRIIGLFKNMELANEEGTSDLVKIIRDDSIGDIVWDSSNSNNWANASLQTLLNNDYLNSEGNYKNSTPIKGITESTRNMIENVKWNIGGNTTISATALGFYNAERENSNEIWNGHIALMYPSDYGYAIGGSNRNDCLALDLANYSNGCQNSNWLYKANIVQWTLTPVKNDTLTDAFVVFRTGLVDMNHTNLAARSVRPSLYLNSNVMILDDESDGSINNPYVLIFNE